MSPIQARTSTIQRRIQWERSGGVQKERRLEMLNLRIVLSSFDEPFPEPFPDFLKPWICNSLLP